MAGSTFFITLSDMPSASAAPVKVTEFVGDISEETLWFMGQTWNDTLAVELPRGSTVLDAKVKVEGLPGFSAAHKQIDFNNDSVGKHLWARHKEGKKLAPPTVDPYNNNWAAAAARDLQGIAKIDNIQWTTSTTIIARPPPAPPLEWPVQLFHFNPQVAGATSVEVMWNGHGICKANATLTQYHAELWLYNHTGSEWEEVKNYSSNVAGNVWLKHSFTTPSPYYSANGSIDVAVVGQNSDTLLNVLPPLFDNGHLNSNYIVVNVSAPGTVMYPEDVGLEAGGHSITPLSGTLTGEVELGDAHGLKGALQAAVDEATVRPGNVTIPLKFSVGNLTAGKLKVSGLVVEYEPPVNLPPVWRGETSVDVEEDSDWTEVMDLDASFTDDFNEGDLVFEVVDVSDPTNLSAQVSRGTGGNHSLEVMPVMNFFGEVTVTVSASDLFYEVVDSDPITVSVLQVGDAPELVGSEDHDAWEETPFTYTYGVEDVDLPDDNFTFSLDIDYIPIDPLTGEINWTPNDTQIGTHRTMLTVRDRYGKTDNMPIRIKVKNINDPPVITSGLAMDTVQDEPASYVIRAEDPDLPFDDKLTYWVFTDTLEVTVDEDTGRLTFTPTNDQVPGFEIVIRVEDRLGVKDEATLQVSVENVNDPPVLGELEDQTFDQGEVVSVQLDVDDPDLGLDLPTPETITIESTGPEVFHADDEGWINFTADQGLVGEYDISYHVSDREGVSTVTTVHWTIVDVNDPPVITTPVLETYQANEDEAFSLDLEAEDVDGDAIEWSSDTALFEIDPSTGEISFVPDQSEVGPHTVTVTLSDGQGGVTQTTFEIVVANVNDAPVIALALPEPGSKFDEGAEVPFQANATDEDGDQLSFTWKEGGKVLGTGKDLPYTDLSPGKHTITLVVSDGELSDERTLTLEVVGEEAGLGTTLMAAVAVVVILAIVGAALLVRRRGPGPPSALEEEDEGPEPPADEEEDVEYRYDEVTVAESPSREVEGVAATEEAEPEPISPEELEDPLKDAKTIER